MRVIGTETWLGVTGRPIRRSKLKKVCYQPYKYFGSLNVDAIGNFKQIQFIEVEDRLHIAEEVSEL